MGEGSFGSKKSKNPGKISFVRRVSHNSAETKGESRSLQSALRRAAKKISPGTFDFSAMNRAQSSTHRVRWVNYGVSSLSFASEWGLRPGGTLAVARFERAFGSFLATVPSMRLHSRSEAFLRSRSERAPSMRLPALAGSGCSPALAKRAPLTAVR